MTAMQSLFPKFTVVAEVKDPVKFGKALDTAIIAINNEFKTQAIELATKQTREVAGNAGGRPLEEAVRGRGPNSADRARRRRLQETPYPSFTATPGQENSYVLLTPHESPLRFVPSGFRPTIHLEGKYLAFSVAVRCRGLRWPRSRSRTESRRRRSKGPRACAVETRLS